MGLMRSPSGSGKRRADRALAGAEAEGQKELARMRHRLAVSETRVAYLLGLAAAEVPRVSEKLLVVVGAFSAGRGGSEARRRWATTGATP